MEKASIFELLAVAGTVLKIAEKLLSPYWRQLIATGFNSWTAAAIF